MQLTLSEMFERSETDTIEWRNQVVRAVIRFPVKEVHQARTQQRQPPGQWSQLPQHGDLVTHRP